MGSGGQVRLRANGTWEGRYYAADHRRASVYGKTKREAQERLREALTRADNGVRPVPRRVSLSVYLDEWLASSVRARCRPRTIGSYEATVARYIKPTIGNVPLARLEPAHVSRMLAELMARRLSPTTVRYAAAVLRIALGRALREGRVLRNVATLVDLPSRPTFEPATLAAIDVARFREAIAGHRWATVYLTALGTGLRQGELLGLKWADLDLDAGTLTVRHTLEASGRLAEPKTDKSRRTLHLPLPVAAELRRLRTRQDALRRASPRWDLRGFVFATRTGGPLDGRNVTRELQQLLVAARLPRLRFHDLRHAFATLQLEAGADLFEVSRALGHADIGTTANVYGHHTAAMATRTAERMAGILAGV